MYDFAVAFHHLRQKIPDCKQQYIEFLLIYFFLFLLGGITYKLLSQVTINTKHKYQLDYIENRMISWRWECQKR